MFNCNPNYIFKVPLFFLIVFNCPFWSVTLCGHSLCCVCVCVCVCVCAPVRESLCLLWRETHTKGLTARPPARPEVDEERKVPEKTEGEFTKEDREGQSTTESRGGRSA